MAKVDCSVCGRSYMNEKDIKGGPSHTFCTPCIIEFYHKELPKSALKNMSWEAIKDELSGKIKWEGPDPVISSEAQVIYDEFAGEANEELKMEVGGGLIRK